MCASVKIVSPVYRPLSDDEACSVRQTARILHRYPICFVVPQGVDAAPFKALVPNAETVTVGEEWLGRKHGIAGYNRMMLSAAFYDHFADTDYILICHTDAWVFRDELQQWCDAGYDCVAAPWIRRRIYNCPFVRLYTGIARLAAHLRHKPDRRLLYGRVGNGGFSLRRVSAFREACTRYEATIDEYLGKRGPLYNEDVFWATVPQEFRYPSQDEALRFAYDTHPGYCYKLAGKTLPFGCHGWTKPRYNKFWKKFIPGSAI